METWLLSNETDEPFRHCIACRMPLLELDRPWLVTKEYHHGECMLEYAICKQCRDEVTARIPETTKAAIRNFLKSEIDWPRRIDDFFAHNNRFARCVACQTPREQTDGFAISALFDETGHLIEGPLPLLMCNPCCTRMKSLLCESSRQIWQEFVDTRLKPIQGDGWMGIW
jgi:hypothetical protein